MKTANINKFILQLQGAFDALGVAVAMPQIEQMAVNVHSAMGTPRRRYHCSEHALYLCRGMAPLQVLAAVFHDVVYYQLDGGFPARVAHYFTPIVSVQGNDLILLRQEPDDQGIQLCLDLFDFAPGQALPLFRGMNEFLSAAVAVRMLEPHLNAAQMITVLACIEATIPFRAREADGQDSVSALAARVRTQACARMGYQPGAALEAFVDGVMTAAVTLSNRDVGSFAEPQPGKFLSGTWLLIEESNAPLAAVGVYTLQDYREALTRMHNFLEGLQADRIFHHYGQAQGDYDALVRTASGNLEFAVEFLRLKILSITIIEALALDSGGNCPVSMFLGDIRASGGAPERIEDYLPAGPSGPALDSRMLDVLENGRPGDASQDLVVSPLTAYIYRCLGPQGCRDALDAGRHMLSGKSSARTFLASLQPDMLRSIMDACMRIALSRRVALQALRDSLFAQTH